MQEGPASVTRLAGPRGRTGAGRGRFDRQPPRFAGQRYCSTLLCVKKWSIRDGGRGDSCFGGDFGDDAATLKRAAAWRGENPELAARQAEFFHRLWDNPGGAVKKEKLLALELSPDYRHECGICDRDYMLRRGCQCCRD